LLDPTPESWVVYLVIHSAGCVVASKTAVVAGKTAASVAAEESASVAAEESAASVAAGVAVSAAAAAAAAPPDAGQLQFVLDWMDSELAPVALWMHECLLVSKVDYCFAMHMFPALVLQQLHPDWERN